VAKKDVTIKGSTGIAIYESEKNAYNTEVNFAGTIIVIVTSFSTFKIDFSFDVLSSIPQTLIYKSFKLTVPYW